MAENDEAKSYTILKRLTFDKFIARKGSRDERTDPDP